MLCPFFSRTSRHAAAISVTARLNTSRPFGMNTLCRSAATVSGVVGSFEVTRQTIDFDTTRALYILALISLSLAVVNLFPFLPLDGGHIFWAVAEKVRGRPIPFSVMERASVVGFMLVAVLFIIGLTNDIGRLTGNGFNVR